MVSRPVAQQLAFSKRYFTTAANQWRRNIAEKNPSVNAMVYTNPEAHSTCHDLPLSGVAIAVKDNITTVDAPTSCSSEMLNGFKSPFDATAVKILRGAGADIVGKTNCDEFGMGSLNAYTIHGLVTNPFQPPSASVPWIEREKRFTGGSSGGSAAAVASGMCYAALGTDTGGSVRLPASYCGVAGLKPSYGLISRWGVVSYADSLDCVGILASKVNDIRRIFELISQYDFRDPTSANPDIRAHSSKSLEARLSQLGLHSNGTRPLQGVRIGVPQEYFPLELSRTIIKAMRNVMKGLQRWGATVVPVSLPSTSYALSSYYVLACAEASSNLARYDGVQYGLHVQPRAGSDLTKTSRIYALSRSAGFGAEVKKRILLGTYALTADAFDNYFLQAQRVRQLVKNDFDRVFSLPNYYYFKDWGCSSSPSSEGVDVLIHPSAIRTAPVMDSRDKDETRGSVMEEELSSYVQDVLTVPASLAGLPALNVPIPSGVLDPESDGWPIGVSVVGQWGSDELVMRVGEAIEAVEANAGGIS